MTLADICIPLSNLAPGACLCCLYESRAQRWSLLGPYITGGLQRGERVLLVAPRGLADSLLTLLRQADETVARVLDSDQLVLIEPGEVLTQQGRLDAEDLIAFVRRETDTALSEGYMAVRITLDMTESMAALESAEELIGFENRLETFTPGPHCQVLCVCDRQRLDPSLLVEVLNGKTPTREDQTSSEKLTKCSETEPVARANNASLGAAKGHDVMHHYSTATSVAAARRGASPDQDGSDRTTTRLPRSSDLLLESAIEYGMFTLDTHGNIASWNTSAERHFGYARREALGEPFSRVYGNDEVQAGRPDLDLESARNHGQHHVEGWRYRKDGTRFHASMIVMALHEDGELAGYTVVFRDLTDKQDAEQSHHAFESKLRRARKLEALGSMARAFAHDFNNLLTGILGNASIALMDLPEESTLRAQLEMIESAAKRAAELTLQMLAYSRSGEGVAEPLDVSALLHQCRQELLEGAQGPLTITCEAATGLPVAEGDTDQLKLVFGELITRVAEATVSPPSIALRGQRIWANRQMLDTAYFEDSLPEGPYVCIEIMAASARPDNTQRARDKRLHGYGRGMGLSQVLHILQEHGGTLGVKGESGHISGFSILLPVSDDANVDLDDGSDTENHEPEEDLILIVDDEESVVRVAEMTLQRAGLKTLSARDGAEAVQIFNENGRRISLVLLDLTMPGMDGMEAFDRIRQICPDARIVLSSGYSEKEVTKHFSNKALAGFIQKPYLPATLVEHVQRILAEKPLRA